MNQAEDHILLGPIVGHTTSASTTIWIRVMGPVQNWFLRMDGHEPVPFSSTEGDNPEFGTALAIVEDLDADTRYSYVVENRDGSTSMAGNFRTMPADDALTHIRFVTLSCNDDRDPNAWLLLQEYIRTAQPYFILMVGDQVYMDESDEGNVWEECLDSPSPTRRLAMIEKYQKLWSREPLATILANTPCYMTWDDHDIRDGWGSFAADSATLAAQYPASRPIYEKFRSFFNDAYDVYFHFQACRNPLPQLTTDSKATPFSFRCGPILVVVTDSRTDRDFARPSQAMLGDAQWQFLETLTANLPADVKAIAAATAVPIVDIDPKGRIHHFFKDRKDDIDLFKKADEPGLRRLLTQKDNPLVAVASLVASFTFDRDDRVAAALGFRVEDLDDVRDKWSYESNRPEQDRLIRLFSAAANRVASEDAPRRIIFLGGDIHVGAIFQLTIDDLRSECVVTSGIAKTAPIPEVKGVLVDESFDVAPGIHAELSMVVNTVNFATTDLTWSDGKCVLVNEIVYEADNSD